MCSRAVTKAPYDARLDDLKTTDAKVPLFVSLLISSPDKGQLFSTVDWHFRDSFLKESSHPSKVAYSLSMLNLLT